MRTAARREYGCFGVYGPEGCQTEYVLMPGADNYAYKIPEGLTEQDVLFTGDILSTVTSEQKMRTSKSVMLLP